MRIEPGGYQRIVRGTPATLSVSFFDGSAPLDPGVVTVTVTRADGTALAAAGSATGGSGSDARTLALTTSDTAQLDLLTCVWQSASQGSVTTTAEIVGGRLFSLNAARAFDQGRLSDAAGFPDDLLEEARVRIEDDFQGICGVSFIPRYAFELYDGRGVNWLILRQYYVETIRSVAVRTVGTTTWTAFSDTDLADCYVDRGGILRRELGVPFWQATQNVRIGYEYGYSQVPFEIRRAALKLLASGAGATSSNLPDRATSLSTADGTFALATPGLRGAHYGIPEVDSVLERFAERTHGFA